MTKTVEFVSGTHTRQVVTRNTVCAVIIHSIVCAIGKDPTSCVYLSGLPSPPALYLDAVKAMMKKQGVSEDLSVYYDGSSKLVHIFST